LLILKNARRTVFFDLLPRRSKGLSFANSEVSRQPQPIDLARRLEELALVVIIVRKFDDIALALAHQSRWEYQEVCTDAVQCCRQILRRQAQPLEPVHDVGCEKYQLEEGNICGPGIGWNFAQRVIVDKLSDVFLDGCPQAVETIHAPRAQHEIGHQDVIDVLAILEQRKLGRVLGVQGNRTAHHDEAMAALHLVMDLLVELGDLPTVAERLEAASSGACLDVAILPRHHHITASRGVQEANNTAAVEARVHAQAHARAGDRRRGLGQTDFEEGHGTGRGAGVARAQAPMPELLETGFEAKQGMVGPAAWLLGVVSHPSAFGPTVDNEDRGVHIEDKRIAMMGQGEQIGAQAVVKTYQLSNAFGRKALQEPAQGALVGESLQPKHFQESAVVLKDVGLVDAAQSHNDREEQGHDQLGRVIGRSSLQLVHMLLKKPAQLQPFAKSLDQPHSAEVRKVRFLEGETKFSGPSGHPAQSTLLGAFVPRDLYHPNCSFLHSEN
jgi:hypothetical protein